MFCFDPRIVPDCPLDPKDPPPAGWAQIDTSDYREALFSLPSNLFEQCCKWEKREIKRIEAEEREKAEKELQDVVDNLTPEEYLQMARIDLDNLRSSTHVEDGWSFGVLDCIEKIVCAIERMGGGSVCSSCGAMVLSLKGEMEASNLKKKWDLEGYEGWDGIK